MEGSERRVLVLAHRTAAAPSLIEAVRDRAAAGPCRFTLLVPASPHGLHRVVDPEDHGRDEAEAVIDLALPHLEEAAGGPMDSMVGAPEPLAAVEDALNRERYDEVIVSTLPTRVSRWLHLDLPRKVAGLGLPVTTVTAKGRERPGPPAPTDAPA
jgi:hypothetical protein